MNKANTEIDWDIVSKSDQPFFRLNLKEVWRYKDLILLLVKRDLTANYKQTILGPIWMFLQPLFTTFIYTFTFGKAGLSTDGMPPILFYLLGQTFWLYFAECFNKTSNTFIANAGVFGKVYFPRLVMPVSVIISNLIRLGIQILMLLIFYVYYYFKTDMIHMQWHLLALIPILIVMLGLFSLASGIFFSSLTTKYRDVSFLLAFALQLLMFVSSVVFPASTFKGTLLQVILCNPVMACIEAIKFIFTGHGAFSPVHLVSAMIITCLVLVLSIAMFNRTERTFMDTV